MTTDVDVIYARGRQSPIKAFAELRARKAIMDYFALHMPHRIIMDYQAGEIVEWNESENWVISAANNIPSIHRSQQLSWFLTAYWYANPKVHSAIEVANVVGDDNLHLTADLAKAMYHLMRATKDGCFYGYPPPLAYPLMERTKAGILKELPQPLIDLIWTCETPSWTKKDGIKACGRCIPCRSLQWEEDSVKFDSHSLPKNYGSTIQKFLAAHGTEKEKTTAKEYFADEAKRKADRQLRMLAIKP
jgi:hypothetical protein